MNNSVSFEHVERESVILMPLHSFDDSRFRSRSGAFAALARLAAAGNRMTESVELYKLAIEEGEECWGPDDEQVKLLLREIAVVYSSLGQDLVCDFYRRRANSI